MGSNYMEYIKEVHRILKPWSRMFICETLNRFKSKIVEFEKELNEIGFKVNTVRKTEKFIYFTAEKD